jgi:alpha-1,2-mannosyltransferase
VSTADVWRRRLPPAEVLVFALALLARLSVPMRGGGLLGNYGYDASVYYAAADGVTHGRVPYRDFVLVHPPLVTWVLAPFAILGRLTSDHIGFVAANLGFTVLGAINAVLVVAIVKRLGLGTGPAVAGGLFYALWLGSIEAEYLSRLEPLGNTLMLCGLLALTWSWQRSGRMAPVIVGVAVGLAVSVKIWWAVPVLIVIAWELLVRRSPRRAGLIALGTVIAGLIVDLPFLVLSRGQMWSMVVSAQLGRPPSTGTTAQRLGQLATVSQAMPHLSHLGLLLADALVGAVAVLLCALALRTRVARLFVVLGVVQLAVVLVGPSWFSFYTDYLAVPAALTVAGAAATLAGAAERRARRRSRERDGVVPWAIAWLPVGCVAALAAVALGTGPPLITAVPGRAHLVTAAAHVRCIMSDTPMALIELDALDRSFRPGCRNWVDVTGRMLGVVKPADRVVRGTPNPVWSRDFADYLLSGDATIYIRTGLGLTGDAERRIARYGAIATNGSHYTLYRTR